MGAELGLSHFAEGGPFGMGDGTGAVTQTGPAWGLRLGVDLLSWIGFEARYIGAYQSGNSKAPDVAYFMIGGEVVLRLALPLPFVRPYIFGGIGVYDWELLGTSSAISAAQLNSSSQAGVPMGVGIETLLSWHVSFAIEGTFRFLVGESFSRTNDAIAGADQTTLTGVLRFRL